MEELQNENSPIQVVDAHVHFWNYGQEKDAWITNDMKILQQDYYPKDLELSLKRNGVAGCIAVQAAQTELETHFLLELAKGSNIIKGIVGWVDLQNEHLPERLEYFSKFPLIKGWRHIVQAEPDDFLLNHNFIDGVKQLGQYGYVYDILVYHRQLPAAIKFVEALLPHQLFVIDHLAKPNIEEKEISSWEENMVAMSRFPNVFCKLSGLFTEAKWKGWSAAEFYPYLDLVFKYFGTSRLIFGSDWPVLLLSGMYVQWMSLLIKYMEGYSKEDKAKVFGLNAAKVYNLG